MGLPWGSMVKNPPASAGDVRHDSVTKQQQQATKCRWPVITDDRFLIQSVSFPHVESTDAYDVIGLPKWC